MDFLVVRVPSTYNIIIGCLSLNILRAIVSTYHLTMKFLTHEGVDEVRGDQILMRQCYTISVRDARQPEAYPIDGLDTRDDLMEEHGEPIEDLDAIPLKDGNPRHMMQIGSKLDSKVR